jgi:SAM-dependent methyltransferase
MDIRRLIEFKPVSMPLTAFAYLLLQVRLSLATLRDWRGSTGPTHEPAPPARLRYRVHGHLNKAGYLEAGKILAQNIQDLCRIAGRDFSSFTDILDFGSGCGRVIQNFRDRPGSYNLYATDIDPDLVSWGKSNLHGIQWSVNGHQPPLPFDDNAFDLIYGISVFTHLDEDFQHVWLRELQRVARPGATLILTVHGEYAVRRLPMLYRSYVDEVHERGFMFITGSKGRFKLDGLPDFYQTTFHTKEYVYNDWSDYFDIVDYIERGIHNFQDAVVLRKPLNRS